MIEAERQEEALAAEVEEGGTSPGVFSTVWTLVGWESVGDFAGDVALTILTGGVGKVIKTGTRVRRVLKATTKFGKLAKAAETMVKLIETVAGGAVPEQLSWLKKNWPTVQRKIMTDLLANSTTGEGDAAGSVAARRIAKQLMGAAIDDLYPTKEEEIASVRLALVAWLAGKQGTARRELTLFFRMNVRRRFITNIIAEASAAGLDLHGRRDRPGSDRRAAVAGGAYLTPTRVPFHHRRATGLAPVQAGSRASDRTWE